LLSTLAQGCFTFKRKSTLILWNTELKYKLNYSCQIVRQKNVHKDNSNKISQ
jgi:hypothetical protein